MLRLNVCLIFSVMLLSSGLIVYAEDAPSGSIYTGEMPLAEEGGGSYGGLGTIEEDSGMPPEYFQDEKERALFDAALSGDYPAIKGLIEQGVNVNARDAQGNTALHIAQDAGIVRLLVENKAEVNAKNTEFEMTPIYNKSQEAARILIESGADLSVRSKKGNTPLHWYAYSGYLEGIKLLLEHGADINACNEDNQSALDIAEEFAGGDTVTFLKAQGGNSCRKK